MLTERQRSALILGGIFGVGGALIYYGARLLEPVEPEPEPEPPWEPEPEPEPPWEPEPEPEPPWEPEPELEHYADVSIVKPTTAQLEVGQRYTIEVAVKNLSSKEGQPVAADLTTVVGVNIDWYQLMPAVERTDHFGAGQTRKFSWTLDVVETMAITHLLEQGRAHGHINVEVLSPDGVPIASDSMPVSIVRGLVTVHIRLRNAPAHAQWWGAVNDYRPHVPFHTVDQAVTFADVPATMFQDTLLTVSISDANYQSIGTPNLGVGLGWGYLARDGQTFYWDVPAGMLRES